MLKLKNVLVTSNLAGDGATSFIRDVTDSLNRLKSPTPNAVAVDLADGELWRQAKRLDGFAAYHGEIFADAYRCYVQKDWNTMPEHNLTERQSAHLKSILTDHSKDLYILTDNKNTTDARDASIVLLIARCDARNFSTLRANYQRLLRMNPNTYVVPTQGGTGGNLGRMTDIMTSSLVEKRLNVMTFNGKPLVVPMLPEAYTLAAREGIPSYSVQPDARFTETQRRELRFIHHEFAAGIRRVIMRTERQFVANGQQASVAP